MTLPPGRRRRRALLAAVLLVAPAVASAEEPAVGRCAEGQPGRPARCLYRSLLPSAGVVVECPAAGPCRAGTYSGDLEDARWLSPPPGVAAGGRPVVFWRTATLAEIRFGCGPGCRMSYFFEARRRRLSAPRWSVLAVDVRRWLLAAAEDPALVVRQIFSGREVARIERPWAPGVALIDAVTEARFDPDGRLSFVWLAGEARTPARERVSVPSLPR